MIGFYVGSFDPFTCGHMEIVRQATKIFDTVIVGVGTNPQKHARFDKQIRTNAIQGAMIEAELTPQVRVVTYEGLPTDEISRWNTQEPVFLIRGLRNSMDYQYEETIASINKNLSGVDTIYLRAGDLGDISSTMVMALYDAGKNVSEFLPPPIYRMVKSTQKQV